MMGGLLVYFQYQALFFWLVLAAGWTISALNRRKERLRRLGSSRHKTVDNKTHRCSGGGGGSPDDAVAGDDARNLPSSFGCGVAAGGGSGGSGSVTHADAGVGNANHGDKVDGAVRRVASPARSRCGLYIPPSTALMPPVCVVMPVKGCRPHSVDNWTSLLNLQYGADLEFVLVVESREDAAVKALEEVQKKTAFEAGGPVGRMRREVKMRVVVAGLAQRCSQKAHNLCAGIESCDPRAAREGGYILCLDDDVALHPSSLMDLVADLQQRPDVFMATGYPFDVPSPGSSFAAYLALAYHLPLLIAFSVAPNTSFVWGGCMLLRADRLLPGDPGGLLRAWRNGGYSDDLILASYCTERRLKIRVPPFAIFPQRLDDRMTWAAWLNYLHRQLFVLDTYTNEHNRKTNHSMMWLHSILSWLLVLPSLAALLTLVSRLCKLLVGIVTVVAVGRYGLVAGEEALLLPLLQLPGGLVAVAAGWAAAHGALIFMTAEILALFRVLSPNPVVPHVSLSWFRWGRLWAAMMLSNVVLPVVMAYTYFTPTVVWGGVVYRKRRGKVAPICRRG
ncbi:hypothetical protein VaNZ11_010841 [Volvox africanus]|uniref:ceramide glucosyltransferase n=1 Tax=Volvox africanus TaxID=51714 RepID=A0ABQ5SAA3_9CHLO|nr:hypothetical protein VaNZ11_010841 [Volvox africanus]